MREGTRSDHIRTTWGGPMAEPSLNANGKRSEMTATDQHPDRPEHHHERTDNPDHKTAIRPAGVDAPHDGSAGNHKQREEHKKRQGQYLLLKLLTSALMASLCALAGIMAAALFVTAYAIMHFLTYQARRHPQAGAWGSASVFEAHPNHPEFIELRIALALVVATLGACLSMLPGADIPDLVGSPRTVGEAIILACHGLSLGCGVFAGIGDGWAIGKYRRATESADA